MHSKIQWPNNKKFAFSIFDDTDRANLNDNKLVYQFLDELNFKTTKSVWIKEGNEPKKGHGITCEDSKYLEWLLELKNKGFEIGYHNTTYSSSLREDINEGLKKFNMIFKQKPNVMANHSVNKENIYWGAHRLSGLRKILYNMLTGFKKNRFYEGQDESSPYFWGDICRDNITYVRNFVFSDINTLKKCPYMPYRDKSKPYVNYWFASSEGNNAEKFNKCISQKNLDRLEKEGGACIMYTHFADGFCKNGKLSEKFKSQMYFLSQKNGWFVTVSTLLDFLKSQNKTYLLDEQQKAKLEWKWLTDKIFLGST